MEILKERTRKETATEAPKKSLRDTFRAVIRHLETACAHAVCVSRGVVSEGTQREKDSEEAKNFKSRNITPCLHRLTIDTHTHEARICS